ncbi:MAG TPA: hypothetical protein VIJ07_19585 [Dermatophilaceae bacterium]|jgi:site-specific DNA recombinase
MAKPSNLYEQATDEARRQLNVAFYSRLYLDDVPPTVRVIRDELMPPFDELREASRVRRQQRSIPSGSRAKTMQHESILGLPARAAEGSDRPVLADIYAVSGSSKTVLVELRGLEPLTPTLPARTDTPTQGPYLLGSTGFSGLRRCR